MPSHPDAGCHADGGIGTGDESDEHDQGEVLCGVPTDTFFTSSSNLAKSADKIDGANLIISNISSSLV